MRTMSNLLPNVPPDCANSLSFSDQSGSGKKKTTCQSPIASLVNGENIVNRPASINTTAAIVAEIAIAMSSKGN